MVVVVVCVCVCGGGFVIDDGRTVLEISQRGSLSPPSSPLSFLPPPNNTTPYLAKDVHRQDVGELQRPGLDQQVLHKKFVEDAGDHLALIITRVSCCGQRNDTNSPAGGESPCMTFSLAGL